MTVVGEDVLQVFIKGYAAAKSPLQSWLAMAKAAKWKTTQDIKNHFRSADFLSGNRVIFNIGGNNFRLVVQIAYAAGVVQVQWVGTHAEYNKKKF